MLSLFRDNDSVSILDDSFGYVQVRDSPKPPRNRISISRRLAESSNSSLLFFLGKEKEAAYEWFLDPRIKVEQCPAKIVQKHQKSYVFTDYKT